MGKKNNKPKKTQDKVVTGSGAEIVSHEDEGGRVKCKCIVPCVWRGYRDEGDTVWIEKALIEKDTFVKMHFEEVDGVGTGNAADGNGNAEGSDGNENSESDNADGGSDNADGGSDNADGGSDNADGCSDNADGADGNGQGELELK